MHPWDLLGLLFHVEFTSQVINRLHSRSPTLHGSQGYAVETAAGAKASKLSKVHTRPCLSRDAERPSPAGAAPDGKHWQAFRTISKRVVFVGPGLTRPGWQEPEDGEYLPGYVWREGGRDGGFPLETETCRTTSVQTFCEVINNSLKGQCLYLAMGH